ncbi:MAG: GAF domain-containing protein [Bacillota bacterium]|uniref:GAF domain-containing protein n=1 Tax=Fictibacillus TaxID=1329200 RepID=UPI0011A20C35|nr:MULTISPECIES: GAF domain-containing protein [Fictibacillus]MBH0168939.1 anti-anti-sigma factor [Fictibacillus sp. 18YEL24]
MTDDYENEITNYYSLKSVSRKMFDLISKQLNVKTTYVTRKGKRAITVLSSFNEDEEIITEGYSVEYGETYCRLIITNEGSTMKARNLMTDSRTRELEVTGELKIKGFLGVTLKDLKGNVFGTLCVMDRKEREFSEDDVNYLHSIAGILSHIIELDETKHHMGFLSVPIIPLTDGVSILSLQGIVDEVRSEQIISDVLHNAAESDIDFFIIDLSKLYIQDNRFPKELFTLINALYLIGVRTIITGVTPAFAHEQVDHFDLKNAKTKYVNNIQSALDYIGYHLIEK